MGYIGGPTMDVLLLCIRVLLAIVLGAAGATKALDPTGTRRAVSDFGLPQWFAKPMAFLLPVAECVTAALLLLTAAAFWGAAVAFALLLAFAVIIAVNLINGRTPECHCFGQLHSRPISWTLVARNAALAIGAAAILREGPGMQIATAARRFTEIAAAQPLPVAALSVAVVGFALQGFLLLALFQQHGRLMLRMDKFEQSASVSGFLGLMPSPLSGLPIGARAPSFELSSGSSRAPLETVLRDGKPVVLVFSDPDCHACAELLPDIERWERQYAEMVTFVVISRAPASGNGAAGAKHVFRNTAWQQENREISESYKVYGVPAAVVLRPDATIGTWLASGRPAIQALVMFLFYTQMLLTANDVVS
jgi:thiol-disulfide isomerase/thioredoxin